MPLNMFFKPRSAAIIGASRHKEKIGYQIFWNFIKGGFKGKVYPINPKAKKILGLKCYSSVLDVPDSIDLAVIAVPAPVVPFVLKECDEKGVRGAVIISGGFAETGLEGRKREEACKKIIEKSKIRVVGPNCIGVYDSQSNVDTLFLSADRLTRPVIGPIAFISQSGAVGSTVLDWLSEEGIGISKFVSYGNAIDIDESDLLEYLVKDGQTKVITAYLEGVKDGRKFLQTAKKVSKIKPIIILKAGKTKKGTEAVSSHTGALAGAAEVYSGSFKQAGVLEANSWETLFDLAKAFASQPIPKGKRTAIITNGGGFGVLATDEAEKQGLELPATSPRLQKIFRANFPSHAILHNPIDLTGDATADRFKIAVEECLKSNEFDALIVILLFQIALLEKKVIDIIAGLNKKYKKPILCCSSGGKFTQGLVKELEEKGLPVYPTPERAVDALAGMLKYRTI